jgi:uncharacterized protein YbjT (DUF2867 family)
MIVGTQTDWPPPNMVTGALSYTGGYIARELDSRGEDYRTLARDPGRMNCLCPPDRPWALRLAFDDPEELTENLRGVETLYNTYWIRFERDEATFGGAIENSKTLIACAKAAGVRRIVHISVSNPSLDSPLPYFRGKALVEEALIESGLSHAIIRPTVVFGHSANALRNPLDPQDRAILLRSGGDILINNIAWLLRRFPLFPVPGNGGCRLQPVFAEDLAKIAVHAAKRDDNLLLDAAGPDTYMFAELVELVAEKVARKRAIVHVSPERMLLLGRLIGRLVNDVLITRDEIDGLMANLLVSHSPPMGETRLSEWLKQNRDMVGRYYRSELKRHWGDGRGKPRRHEDTKNGGRGSTASSG